MKKEIYNSEYSALYTVIGTIVLVVIVALGIGVYQGAWLEIWSCLWGTFAVLGGFIIFSVCMYVLSIVIPYLGYNVCQLFKRDKEKDED